MKIKNTRQRDMISPSNFVFPPSSKYPHGKYPIHDLTHARAALSMSSRFGTADIKAKVRAAVCRKYPEIQSCKMRKIAMIKMILGI